MKKAIQQLCGNLFSALLLPVCEWAALYEFPAPMMIMIIILIMIWW